MAPYAGTFLNIRNAVIDRLKLDADADFGRVDEWIILAYYLAIQETGCLQACGSVELTADEEGYLFPDQVEQVKAMHYVYSDGTISKPLEQRSLDEILQLRRQNMEAGERTNKSYYAVLGQNRFELWPDPSEGAVLKFWYVYLPDQPTFAVGETPLIKEPYGSKLLELGACIEGAKFKKDPLIQSYQQEYMEWMRRFQGWLNRRNTGTGVTMRMITGNEQPTLSLVSESEAI